MKSARLGCFSTSGMIASVLTALIVAGFAFAQGGVLFNPGALNAQSGTLLGGVSSHAEIAGQCNLCHAPFWSTSTMADRCLACHTDVTAQWQDPSTLHGVLRQNNPNLACRNCHPDHHGPDSPLVDLSNASFPHNSFGFLLTSHQHKTDGSPFGCKDCHAQVYTGFDQAVCTACHIQVDTAFVQTHTLDFGNDCVDCHDGLDRFGHNFDHNEATFPLTGQHAEVMCAKCHINARVMADLKSTPQDCNSCHATKDPHVGRYGKDCGTCHTTTGWTPAKFDHNLSIFKLDGKHINVACQDCHIDHIFVGTPTDCFSCHEAKDSHKGSLGADCATCHTTASWKQSTYDHNLSVFKLAGKHTTTDCASCHINHVYHGTPSDCYSCHKRNDNHKGNLGTACGSCHAIDGWKPSTFDHNLAAFKLTGKHTTVACASCHINGLYKGASSNCNSCHKIIDPHAGRYGASCGTCHTTTAWKPSTFDHNLATFKLTGKHTTVACASCHANGVYKGTLTTCYSCHAIRDAHGGQFGTDCGSCHSTSGWTPASFDHNLATFKLTGRHTTVACASCHVNGIYKGTPTNCYSCHAARDAHGGQFGTDCGSCHSTSSWTPASFDHSRSGFALTGAHTSLNCTRCHSGGIYGGLSTACIACHAEPSVHAGQFGTDCAQCHSTSNWNATFNHPGGCDGNCANHQRATCADCHPVNYSTATCLKCHDSNNPDD